jgi:F0F1-type ATP synthase assembly protein I
MRAAPERTPATRRAGAAYQGALEAVFAILISGGAGYWVDARFGSAPLGLLVGLAIGFGAFVLRLFRLGRQLERAAGPEPSGAERSENGKSEDP